MTRINGGILGIVTVLAALGFGMGRVAMSDGAQSNPMIPALMVLGGVAGLMLLLIMAGVAYKGMDIADPTQAFGLPEGSIRAIVATMALLLFGIVPLFLFITLFEGEIRSISSLTQLEAIDLQNGLKETYLMTSPSIAKPKALPPVDPSPTPPTPPTGNTMPAVPAKNTPQPDTSNTLYTVFYRREPSAAAADLSKQFFTALATLVAAMSSFFFGSAVTASATKAGVKAAGAGMTPVPTLRSVDPSAASVAKPAVNAPATPQPLSINGSGLDLVTKVDLVQGTTVVSAFDVTSNPNVVKCSVPVSSTMTGKWSVVVTTSDNKKQRLDDVFTA